MLNKAYLIIDDLKLVIKDYSMRISKDVDFNNKYPSKKGQHRGFQLTVEAPQNNFLWEEAIKNYSMTPLMQIRFEPAILGSEKTRIISMYDCHVVYCRTSFNSTDNQPITDTVHITCGGVEDSYYPSTVYEEHWRVTYPNTDETTEENTELQIIECYYTDLEGNKTAEPKVGEEVYLILKTENGVGKTTDLDLRNQTKDFVYNGAVVKNDIIKDFSITSDEDQLKLKVIAQEQKEVETTQNN